MRLHHIIATLLVALISATACRTTTQQQASSYKTITLSREDRTIVSEYSARMEGRQVVEIRPQVSGFITGIRIGEGSRVRKGQLLFVIEQDRYEALLKEAEANVKSAEARLSTAQLNYESMKMLRSADVVKDYDLHNAENTLAAAEAELAQARASETAARIDYEHTMVTSPVDGVAGMLSYRVGSLVNSSISEPLVTVSDDSVMYVYFSMTESRVTDLVGQYGSLDAFMDNMPPVSLRMSNGRMYPHQGRISAMSGIVSSGTGAVTIRADFPNAEGLLRGGGSATVMIPTVLKDCIVVPQGATYELQDRFFAYKVVDGRAHSVPVTVGRLNNGTEYIVESGLEEGDVIVAEGAGLVREGALVLVDSDGMEGRE